MVMSYEGNGRGGGRGGGGGRLGREGTERVEPGRHWMSSGLTGARKRGSKA